MWAPRLTGASWALGDPGKGSEGRDGARPSGLLLAAQRAAAAPAVSRPPPRVTPPPTSGELALAGARKPRWWAERAPMFSPPPGWGPPVDLSPPPAPHGLQAPPGIRLPLSTPVKVSLWARARQVPGTVRSPHLPASLPGLLKLSPRGHDPLPHPPCPPCSFSPCRRARPPGHGPGPEGFEGPPECFPLSPGSGKWGVLAGRAELDPPPRVCGAGSRGAASSGEMHWLPGRAHPGTRPQVACPASLLGSRAQWAGPAEPATGCSRGRPRALAGGWEHGCRGHRSPRPWLEPPESRVAALPATATSRSFLRARSCSSPRPARPGHARRTPPLRAAGARRQAPPQPVSGPSGHPASGGSQLGRGRSVGCAPRSGGRRLPHQPDVLGGVSDGGGLMRVGSGGVGGPVSSELGPGGSSG